MKRIVTIYSVDGVGVNLRVEYPDVWGASINTMHGTITMHKPFIVESPLFLKPQEAQSWLFDLDTEVRVLKSAQDGVTGGFRQFEGTSYV